MFNNHTIHSGRVVIERVSIDCPPGAMLEALARFDGPVLLDSAALHDQYGRYSILTCCPIDVICARDGVLTDRSGNVLADGSDQLWKTLDRVFGAVEADCRDTTLPYGPGWYGYLGYELGRNIEQLPATARRDTRFADLMLGFYDAALIYDALENEWWLTELKFDSDTPGAGSAAKALRRIASNASELPREPFPAATEKAEARAQPAREATSNFTPDEYRAAVARCVEYIAAGDIFQVNLSQRFTVNDPPAPRDVYRALRRRNPAWYAAYLGFEIDGENCAILSSSPELFLRVRGDYVLTRPIKGTRPRIGLPDADAQAARQLLASPKDNAELAMIIDLLRNDIGRVCEFSSVRVTDPCRLETHPTVFHLVGTVEGRLRPDVGAAELIRATFPGGSITGAPKIRAMEIIDELESVARGPYTGCIGHVGVNGCAEWNIAIRTIVCDGDKLHIQVGGGIIADSQPESEYRETLVKARAILEALAEVRQPIDSPKGQA